MLDGDDGLSGVGRVDWHDNEDDIAFGGDERRSWKRFEEVTIPVRWEKRSM
jgi:hypothetical protein